MQAAHELEFIPAERHDELTSVIALALPLAAANLGQMLLSAVSTAVVGRTGPTALGAVGLGSSLFFTVAVVGMGVMLGLDPMIAQALGSGDRARASRALWQGVWLALAFSLPLAALVLGAGALLERAGIDAASADATREYLHARLPGLLPYLWFIAARSFLGAHGQGRVVLSAVIVANIANVPLSIALVAFFGIAGAGWAATLATLLQLAVMARAVEREHPRELRIGFDREMALSALKLGAPVGLGLLAEFGVFALVNVLVGRADPHSLAAHQVAITIASMSFMVPVGIGAAAAARVGHAVGRGDAIACRRAGVFSLQVSLAFMLLAAGLFLLLPESLSTLITSDRSVVQASIPLLAIAALFQLSDGAQAVLAGALRGVGDTKTPLWANLVGHYLLGLPLGIALAFGFGQGAKGLWWGLSLGLSVVALSLWVRFTRLCPAR